MTCQTEQQDLVTPIKDLTPGTLFRFRFESPWKYFMVAGYGTTDKVPTGFPNETIKFLIASKGIVGEMPLFRFKSALIVVISSTSNFLDIISLDTMLLKLKSCFNLATKF